jgi:hypothetical protein
MAKKVFNSAATKLHRNSKRKPAKPKPERTVDPLDPKDDHYFSDLGERGGKKTLKNKGRAFFQFIARLSHEKRRANKIKRENKARGFPVAD